MSTFNIRKEKCEQQTDNRRNEKYIEGALMLLFVETKSFFHHLKNDLEQWCPIRRSQSNGSSRTGLKSIASGVEGIFF